MLSQFTRVSMVAGVVAVASGSAIGAYQNNMFGAGIAPSTYGSLVGSSFDTNSAVPAYNWGGNWDGTAPDAGYTTSGYIDEVDVGGGSMVELERTQLISEVYRVDTQTTFNDGGDSITLDPGDMVFSYRIKLVGNSTSTVNSLKNVAILGFGFNFNGVDYLPFAADGVLGRGFYKSSTFAGSSLAGDQPDPIPGDLTGNSVGGGQIDFLWDGDDSLHLQNDEEITLLVFTEPSAITQGWMSFESNPGQDTGVDPNANFAPVLIPTIPTPGTAALLVGAGAFAGIRRRR